MEMSLNEWVAEAGIEREDCFKHGYRELYLDIGFFNAQFASVEFLLTYLLLLATGARGPEAVGALASSLDARAKVDRFREAAAGRIGANLGARLGVFAEQSFGLRSKLRHSTILPGDDWPESYEFFSMLERPRQEPDEPAWAEPSENVKADRIWKHGMWLRNFVIDLGTVALTRAITGEFEITVPRTPVLEAGRL